MKTIIFIVVCSLLLSFHCFSQGFNTFIAYLKSLPEEQRMAVVDSFMIATEPSGFPYITGDSANFIFRGEANSVKIVGDLTYWSPSFYYMSKIAGTNFFYRSRIFERNARIEYLLVMNEVNWIPDPLNPNPSGLPNSVLTMPDYIPPWETETYPWVPKGTLVEGLINSSYVGEHAYKVYLPPGYDPNLPGGYPVAYFQDGFDYLNKASANNILDNLIDSNLCSPIIGVFVNPNNRTEEYAGSLREEYQLFFTEELVPFIDDEYHTIRHAWARAAIGASFGANISALISYNYADLFGLCGMHSAAIYPNNYEVFYLVWEGELKSIRWASIWGIYEELWELNREFRDTLIYYGYNFTWHELPEGHNWAFWRAHTDDLLSTFFPPGFLGTEEHIRSGLTNVQLYPNPLTDEVNITYILNEPADVIWQVFDCLGKLVKQNIYSGQQQGIQHVYWNAEGLAPGIYYYRLTTNGERQTANGKLMVVR